MRAVLDPPAIDRRIPADIVRIVARCIAKDPRQRFADMNEVVAALDRAIARRGRDRRILIAVLLIVTIVGGLSLTAWRVRVWRSRHEAKRLNEYGRTALEKGEFGEARRLFLAARSADPKYLTACTNLGALALLDKDPSWAVAILGDCAASF